MTEGLASLLRCPETLEPLERQGDAWISSSGRRYPVVREISRFVGDEQYAGNFGKQWKRFARTQVDDEPMGRSEVQFRQITGWTPEQLRGRRVLDVGCGTGRYLEVAARWGAEVVGLDLSEAVEVAKANSARNPQVEIVQASVLEPPLARGSFDFVYSIGVLHHTPDARAAFHAMAELARNGGEVAVWVYQGYNPLLNASSAFWRRMTRRLPWRLLVAWSWLLTWSPIYWLGRSRLLRPLTWLVPVSIERESERRLLDTIDWYGPEFQSKHRYPEVFEWFTGAGFEEISPREPAVAMKGRKSSEQEE